MRKRESLTMEDPTRNVDGVQLRRELRRAAVWAALALAALVGIYYVLLVPFMDPLDPWPPYKRRPPTKIVRWMCVIPCRKTGSLWGRNSWRRSHSRSWGWPMARKADR